MNADALPLETAPLAEIVETVAALELDSSIAALYRALNANMTVPKGEQSQLVNLTDCRTSTGSNAPYGLTVASPKTTELRS